MLGASGESGGEGGDVVGLLVITGHDETIWEFLIV